MHHPMFLKWWEKELGEGGERPNLSLNLKFFFFFFFLLGGQKAPGIILSLLPHAEATGTPSYAQLLHGAEDLSWGRLP